MKHIRIPNRDRIGNTEAVEVVIDHKKKVLILLNELYISVDALNLLPKKLSTIKRSITQIKNKISE